MDRLILIRNEVNAILEEQPNQQLRDEGYIHLYGVSNLSAMLAIKRGLNMEIASVIGMLHDIYTYKYQYAKNHAALGVDEAGQILEKVNVFSQEEVQLIKVAIANHSDKKNKQDKYSELIKDADLMQNFLYYNVVKEKHKKRLKKALKDCGIKVKKKFLISEKVDEKVNEKDENLV